MKLEEIAQSQKLEMSRVRQQHLQRQEVSYQRIQKRLNPEFIKCFVCKVGLKTSCLAHLSNSLLRRQSVEVEHWKVGIKKFYD